MKLLDDYFELQEKVSSYFGYRWRMNKPILFTVRGVSELARFLWGALWKGWRFAGEFRWVSHPTDFTISMSPPNRASWWRSGRTR